MISISHWGLFEPALSDEDDGWIAELMNNPGNPKSSKMPSWWAGSAAYQTLNFGPYLD